MLADIASPIYLGPSHLFAYSLVALAIIVLIEAVVLRLLGWGSWKIAFIHGFVINLVTSLIGTGLIALAKEMNFAYEVPLPILFGGAFVLTVMVEAAELKVLRLSASFSRITMNSLVANIFSYVFLAGVMYLTLYPPQIGWRNPGPHIRPTPFLSPSPSS
jgi:hypothetical protein